MTSCLFVAARPPGFPDPEQLRDGLHRPPLGPAQGLGPGEARPQGQAHLHVCHSPEGLKLMRAFLGKFLTPIVERNLP